MLSQNAQIEPVGFSWEMMLTSSRDVFTVGGKGSARSVSLRARRIEIHGLPNKIGMVKNASDHDNAMRDIRVCAHASIEMRGLLKKIGRVKNAPIMIARGATLGLPRTPY